MEELITYALVTRATVEELFELRKWLKEKQLKIIFDKISSNPIRIVEDSLVPKSSELDNEL